MSEETSLVAQFQAIEAESAGQPQAAAAVEQASPATQEQPQQTEPTTDEEQTEAHAETEAETEGVEEQGLLKLPEGREEQRKLLHEVAKALGLHVTEARVEPVERVKWREEKRQQKAALDALRSEVEAEKGKLSGTVVAFEQAKARAEAGDYDGFTRAVFGIGVDEFVQKVAAGPKDPAQSALEQKLKAIEEREAAARKREEEAQAKARQAEQQQARIGYVGELKGFYSKQTKPELKAIADRPDLIDAIIDAQERAWDPDDGSTIDALAAAEYVLAEKRKEYDNLSKLFGSRPALVDETGTPPDAPRDGSRPAKRVPTVSRSRATAPNRGGTLSDDDFMRIAKEEMARAWAADTGRK